jgi:hypothetical protein
MTGTDTIHFIKYETVPKDVQVTLARLVASIRREKSQVKPIRLTARGNLVD